MSSSGVALIVLVCWSSIASAQWTPLANAFPSGFAEACLLLTDGTVMCHEYNANRWHRLKPDINGSYQNIKITFPEDIAIAEFLLLKSL